MSAPVSGQNPLDGVADAVDAAILAYGLLGPALRDPAQSQAARDDEQAHRDVRDQLLTLLAALGHGYVLRDPGAALPSRVADDRAARHVAAQVEDAAAMSWRALLSAAITGAADPGATAGAAALALQALTACALRAYRWSAIDSPAGSTRPFPGLSR